MKLHAIQTGSVRIKTAQVEGRGRELRRRLAIFADSNWTEWLPTFAWVIDHPEGVIVVDTGQGTHLLESGKALIPEYETSKQLTQILEEYCEEIFIDQLDGWYRDELT